MTTAIVVARGGSVRLPNKALLPFGESTLIGHKVQALKRCRRIDRVVVGSDSPEILNEAAAHGALVVRRDAYHCDETCCSANEMIRDMVSKTNGDVILWAHPTNPLVRAGTYDRALDVFDAACGFDSLVSVHSMQRHAWYGGRPLNFDLAAAQSRHPFARELAPVSFQDGAIFIQTRAGFLKTSYFFGSNPVLFEMDAIESTDVDTREDYELAKSLYASRDFSERKIPAPVSGAVAV